MRRADRLFDIIQTLRAARHPLTAAAIAEKLEVTVRTIYRDIAALQASRVPIEGAPGLGYVLRRGFDLPPLMFTLEETDAIAIGVRLLRRLRDPKLQKAARKRARQARRCGSAGITVAARRSAAFRIRGQRPGGQRDRPVAAAQRDPRDAQACRRLCRRRRPSHAENDLADRDGLLCRCNPSLFAIFGSTAFSARNCSTKDSRPTAAS